MGQYYCILCGKASADCKCDCAEKTTNEQRIKRNESFGYTLVYTGDGFEIYKKKNESGCWVYYSDSNSNEGSLAIFDDCIMSKEEFIAIGKDLYNLDLK